MPEEYSARAQAPYLLPMTITNHKEYTLVLDLDETLIFCQQIE